MLQSDLLPDILLIREVQWDYPFPPLTEVIAKSLDLKPFRYLFISANAEGSLLQYFSRRSRVYLTIIVNLCFYWVIHWLIAPLFFFTSAPSNKELAYSIYLSICDYVMFSFVSYYLELLACCKFEWTKSKSIGHRNVYNCNIVLFFKYQFHSSSRKKILIKKNKHIDELKT